MTCGLSVVTAVVMLSQTAAVLPASCARPTGHWGLGSPQAIALIEDHPLPIADPMVISGWGTVLSVSLIDHPDPIASSSLVAPDVVHDLVVDGDLVFAALGPTGVLVLRIAFDGSELLAPIARVRTPGEALSIALRDNTLAIACGDAGASLVDVSNPERPHFLGGLQATEHVSDVAYDESRLVVADGGVLRVLDVTRPSHPIELSATDAGDWLTRVEVRNGIASVGSVVSVPWGISAGSFKTFDLRDPRQPVAGGFVNAGSAPSEFVLADNLAFVSYPHGLNTWNGALQIVNLDDPLDPQVVGERIFDASALAVATTGRLTLVGSNGIEVLDTDRPSDPIVLHTAWDDNLAAHNAILCGGVLVVANDGGRELRFVQLEAGRPQYQLGRLRLATTGSGLACRGDVVFAGASLVTAVDVSDPTHPRKLDTLATSGTGSNRLVVNGDIVYTGGWSSRVVDARDPSNLVQLGYLDVPGSPGTYGTLTMAGHHLFATYDGSGEARLRILDATLPDAPVVVSDISLPSSFGTRAPSDIVVRDGVAMIVGDRLATVNVSDPSVPTVLEIVDLPLGAAGGPLNPVGDRLFVSQGTGVSVLDGTDPAHPRALGAFPTPGNATATVWVDDNLVVIDDDQGVTSFDVSRCRPIVARELPAVAVID
ncbi:MAG: hypothetical protein AB1Z65_01460 [Candidatus Sulfomarinibacteraceae bacterium]